VSGFSKVKTARGAVAIEFSLVFVLLFMLFYGIAGYFVPLLLGASYQQVAGDALREAVAMHFRPGEPIDLQAHVRQHIHRSSIPESWLHTCPGYPDNGFLRMDGAQWQVCLRHAEPASLIPPFRIFGWQVPQLPDDIRGEAAMRLH
jgi:hypothetical protein